MGALSHCQKAGAARRAVEEHPGPVSAIIMKLLAKTAEERYQTASGVESDLRRCHVAWETQCRVDEFALGKHDTPDRLLIPEKLYGRAVEIDTLLASFDRVVASGTPELVLVSGYSGIGKSSVVNELHKVLVPPRGLFVSGKFDQYRRDIPYATLAQAFQSLIRTLLSKSEAELRNWRDALSEALGPNGPLIVNLVPELKLIIGEQPPVPDLPPQDAHGRFQQVFRRFIGVFARPEHPLALFLDDLQWLDAATLELLEDLLTRPDVQHLMLIGAYRDNEVDSAHPLMRKLEAIRQAGAIIQEIILAPLACEDLGRLIGDSLHCEADRVSPLARLVHEKTAGNNEALANELAAHFYTARGFEKVAHAYLRDARYCYLRWGADGKVRQLDELYLHLREEEPVPGPTSTIASPVEHLDLATVIKVSQAVSGEIVLEKLIDTLMRTAIEHAGAERGLLVLPRGVEQWLAAEATTSGDTIIVRLREASVTEAAVPESIVHYVVRTQESVMLDDASAQNPFSTDSYIRRHHARSILCLPLINQAKLIGVLYLENNLTPYVFTPTRIAVLKLLASQAAISLENTRLFRDLEETRSEDPAPG
jgi:GAF domain-containing protein